MPTYIIIGLEGPLEEDTDEVSARERFEKNPEAKELWSVPRWEDSKEEVSPVLLESRTTLSIQGLEEGVPANACFYYNDGMVRERRTVYAGDNDLPITSGPHLLESLTLRAPGYLNLRADNLHLRPGCQLAVLMQQG